MSSLHQGVLRAVRLLPDVVKIGVEPDTALPPDRGEEQILNEGNISDGGNSPESQEVSEAPKPREEPKQTPAAPVIDHLKELQSLIAALETQLNEAKGKEQGFMGQIKSLEAEVSATKNAYAQKERELAAGADAVKAQAKTEGREQGHSEGLQKGYDEGLKKAQIEVEGRYREKFSSLAAALEGISARLEEQFSELVELNQPRMLRLWQVMLKKMLLREMTLAPDVIFKVLADVLSRLSDMNHVLIYVSPDDLGLLEDKLEGEFGDILRGVKHLELKSDAHVDKGSCLLETNLGIYDARWRTQFEQIDAVFESLFQQLGKTPQQVKTKESRTRAVKKKSEAGAKNV